MISNRYTTLKGMSHNLVARQASQIPAVPVHFGEEEKPKTSKAKKYFLPVAGALALLGLAGCNGSTVFQSKAPAAASNVAVIQTAQEGGVVVNGNSSVKKDPDSFTFNTYIQESHADYNTVVQNLSQRGESLSKALEALNLSLECSSSVSVQPKYQYKNDGTPPELVGYQGNYTLRMKGDVKSEAQFKKDASDLTKVIAQHQALFNGPFFALNNRDQAEQEALEKAIQETVAKARTTAKTMGFHVNEKTPFSVHISESSYSNNSRYESSFRGAALSDSPESSGIASDAFKFKQLEVQSPQVTVRFNIDPQKDTATDANK